MSEMCYCMFLVGLDAPLNMFILVFDLFGTKN